MSMNHPTPFESCARAARFVSVLLALVALAGCGKSTTIAPVLPPLKRVVVSPTTDTLQVGNSGQFAATAYDSTDRAVSGVPFTWTSGNPAVFTVTGSGRAQGVSEGTAMLFVEAGGRSDSATVAVYPDTGWFTQTSNTVASLNGVFFQPDGRHGWAVGDGGTVLTTADAGVTWTPRIAVAFNLNAVWFTSPLEGWVVGGNGTVLSTTDGGANWNPVSGVGASENLLDVWFATPDTGWVVGANGVVLRTFDRGVSWARLQPTGSTLNGVSFAGTRDGWAVGDGGVILGTHDRGLTWFVVQPSVTAQALKAVWRRSVSAAFAAGNQGAMPRTVVTPDSVAWELKSVGAAYQLEGIHFPTDAIGYAVGYNGAGAVLRSDDGGATWESQVARTGNRLNDVFFIDPLHGWAVGNGGTIVHTARGGLR